jgi:hypothetical protein
VPITVGGRPQVVFLSGEALLAVEPERGSLLWRVPWKTSYDVNAATPVFVPPQARRRRAGLAQP